MVKTYARPPPMFVKGEGCYLWDVENRKYLDLTAGIAVNALGHCDPEMSKLIAQQVRYIDFWQTRQVRLMTGVSRQKRSYIPQIYITILGLVLCLLY